LYQPIHYDDDDDEDDDDDDDFFYGSHPNVSLGTNNNNKVPSNTTDFIMIKVATCFDPTGSSSGLHYEPTTQIAAYIVWDPKRCYK
jgi:hypothetical protein